MNLNPLQKIISSNMRTGTKFVIINWVVTILLIIFMIVGLPLLSMVNKVFLEVIRSMNISAVIGALLGQSSLCTVAQTLRVAIENKALGGRVDKDKLPTNITGD